ncbi:hypothetical protein TIFTF001_001446 [Ficus carica]|uniref:Uncharacterized protein n=1 Tax=Ficus carica TaxID=3494 RepID=A0AA87Z6R2_FICCA|nr:hypothetical protein TIFTF001_001446 [Ficus carica]
MVSRFVSLDLLDLWNVDNANDQEALKISSPSLRKLVMRACRSFNDETTIVAPNLCSVNFTYNKYPFYYLPTSNNLSQNHLILHKDFNYSLLENIVHNLKFDQNFMVQVTVKPILSCEAWGQRLFWPYKALYIASPSSLRDTNVIKDLCRWKRTKRCCSKNELQNFNRWKHGLKDVKIESLNLEQVLNTVGDQHNIGAPFVQAYQALSYKHTRIYSSFNKKRSRE